MPPLLRSILARHPLRRVALLIALCWLAAPIAPAHSRPADSWYVATFGSDQNDCHTPTTPCASVQAVLANPQFIPGSVILTEQGAYYYTGTGEETLLLDKDVVISGGWNSTFTELTGQRTVFSGYRHIGVTVAPEVTVILDYISASGGEYDPSDSSASELQQHTFATKGGIRNYGNLTMSHSRGKGFFGYGISNSGMLTMTESDVSVEYGTGIENSGVLRMIASEVVSVRTDVGCAGIANRGTLLMDGSLLRDNRSRYGDGGLCNFGDARIDNSLIVQNISHDPVQYAGGGIVNFGTLWLTNSIVWDNRGYTSDLYNGGTVYLANSTIPLPRPGNSVVNRPDGTIYSRNSIIWECIGAIESDGYNLLVESAGCEWQGAAGDQLDRDPFLDETHTPRPGSAALNRGNPAGCRAWDGSLLATDGRGAARWRTCDIGAYEYVPPPGEIFTRHLPLVRRGPE